MAQLCARTTTQTKASALQTVREDSSWKEARSEWLRATPPGGLLLHLLTRPQLRPLKLPPSMEQLMDKVQDSSLAEKISVKLPGWSLKLGWHGLGSKWESQRVDSDHYYLVDDRVVQKRLPDPFAGCARCELSFQRSRTSFEGRPEAELRSVSLTEHDLDFRPSESPSDVEVPTSEV